MSKRKRDFLASSSSSVVAKKPRMLATTQAIPNAQLAARLSRLERDVEKKYFDSWIPPYTFALSPDSAQMMFNRSVLTDWAGTSGINQGVAQTERLGMKIRVTNVIAHLACQGAPGADTDFDCYIILDKAKNGGLPASTDLKQPLFGPVAFYEFNNLSRWPSRFQVLAYKHLRVPTFATGDTGIATVTLAWKGNLRIDYGGSNTGDDTNIINNNIFVWVLPSIVGGSNVAGAVRARFVDA